MTRATPIPVTTPRGPIPMTVGTFEAHHWEVRGDTVAGEEELGTQSAGLCICST